MTVTQIIEAVKGKSLESAFCLVTQVISQTPTLLLNQPGPLVAPVVLPQTFPVFLHLQGCFYLSFLRHVRVLSHVNSLQPHGL